jgi:hypothetical protein
MQGSGAAGVAFQRAGGLDLNPPERDEREGVSEARAMEVDASPLVRHAPAPAPAQPANPPSHEDMEKMESSMGLLEKEHGSEHPLVRACSLLFVRVVPLLQFLISTNFFIFLISIVSADGSCISDPDIAVLRF